MDSESYVLWSNVGFGFAPTPGIELGLEFAFGYAPSVVFEPDLPGAPSSPDGRAFVSAPAAFIDFHASAHNGFHAGISLGPTFTTVVRAVNGHDYDLSGMSAGAFAGYDFWIADDWALGPMAGIHAAVVNSPVWNGDITAYTLGLSLLYD